MIDAAEAKRLDSLARSRAYAELKRRHEEEWAEIKAVHLANLRVEHVMLGEVDTERSPRLHVAGENGKCEHCGEPSPCQQERKRIRRIKNGTK